MTRTRLIRHQFSLYCAGLLLGAASGAFGAANPPVDPLDITLTPIGRYTNGAPYNLVAAEVVKHDPVMQRLYLANARDVRLDVIDIHNPAWPIKVGEVDLSPYGGTVTSVAVDHGLIAVAVVAAVKTDPGKVVILNPQLQVVNVVPVGALPDFITFTPNGRWVLTANEGEPNTYNDYGSETNGPSIDPEGSITIIDLATGVATPTVNTAAFTAFNDVPLDPGIRIFGPNATVAQDLEPEGIAISADSTTAYVTLQENNAMAIVDIARATVTDLIGLGFKDHSQPGFGLDPSDQDGGNYIANWPLWGIYMSDEVRAFEYRGQTFLVMANEGDTRNYPGFNEEVKVSALSLDPTVFPNAAELKKTNNLGRLTVTKTLGDVDGDGDYDAIFSLGGRSFTIRTATGEIVFDSGDQFEQLTAALYPKNFNCSNSSNSRDGRSASKGPEPEGVALGKVAGRLLAFIGFERIGGIIVYDVSNPFSPELVDYVNTRNFANPFNFDTAGDLGPEGLCFISAGDSPNGKPLLAVAHEVSGSVVLYQINKRAYKAEL